MLIEKSELENSFVYDLIDAKELKTLSLFTALDSYLAKSNQMTEKALVEACFELLQFNRYLAQALNAKALLDKQLAKISDGSKPVLDDFFMALIKALYQQKCSKASSFESIYEQHKKNLNQAELAAINENLDPISQKLKDAYFRPIDGNFPSETLHFLLIKLFESNQAKFPRLLFKDCGEAYSFSIAISEQKSQQLDDIVAHYIQKTSSRRFKSTWEQQKNNSLHLALGMLKNAFIAEYKKCPAKENRLNIKEERIFGLLNQLNHKAKTLEVRGYPDLALKISNLQLNLSNQINAFQSGTKTSAELSVLKERASQVLSPLLADKELNQHRGLKKIVINLVAAIGLNVLYFSFLAVSNPCRSGFWYHPNTDSKNLLSDINNSIDALSAKQINGMS